jgi:phosphatidylglycerophosphatase A
VGGVWLVVVLGAALFAAGVWATAEMTRGSDNHDPSEVVMDEVVGQWIALLPVLIGAAHVGAPTLALWPGWVVAFLAFRLFDIWKPGPIGWADRRSDPLGVMLDDVIAGVFAAITVALSAAVVHGFLM